MNSSPKRRDVVEVRGGDVPVPEVPEYLPRKILINRTAVVRDLDRAGGGARRDGMVEWGDPQLLPVDLDDGVFEGAGDVEGSRLGDPQVEGGRAPRFPPRGDLALRRLPCVAVRVDMPEKAFVGKAVLHVTVSEERALQHSEIHRRRSRFEESSFHSAGIPLTTHALAIPTMSVAMRRGQGNSPALALGRSTLIQSAVFKRENPRRVTWGAGHRRW